MQGFLKIILFVLFLLIIPTSIGAKTNAYLTIVNPIRGAEFWDQKNQKPIDAVISQMEIINSQKVAATFLIRFDVFSEKDITDLLKKNSKHELGAFLEVTPTLTNASGVAYHKSNSWHDPESVFLTGYSPEDRKKIIDAFFTEFKKTFGIFPKSVGAWWIDANSLEYMNKKYGVAAAMIVADQYSTDNYRIWGQYFGAPYYPFRKNTLLPAQSPGDKIPVVITQWAARDPYNGYGKAVEESTYSVQANDYIDFWDLDINYFNKLLDIYTKTDNKIAQLTIGLENSYNWNKYKGEYERQIKSAAERAGRGELTITTMSDFAKRYKAIFPGISPQMTFFAQNPLDPNYKVVWFMNPYYRTALFFDKKGIRIRDLREYNNSEEPCLLKSCSRINFINSFISSVDDVANGKSFYIDEGQETSLKVTQGSDKVSITYTNSKGENRKVEFLPRDISIDGENFTISGLILKTNLEYYEREPLNVRKSWWEALKDWFFGIIQSLYVNGGQN